MQKPLLKICIYPLSISILIFIHCSKINNESPVESGQEYFPLSIHKSIIYDVDSIIFDPQPNNIVKIDTLKWQFNEVIKDTFRDNAHILNYKIERSERRKGAEKWQTTKIISSAIAPQHVLMTENNLTYIKFPLFFTQKTTWDSHIFNDYSAKIIVAGETLEPFSKKWVFKILTSGQTETVNGKKYEDVLTIAGQIDSKILTEKRYMLEKYAKNIGLIYRELHILDTQKLDAATAWEKKAEKGFILIQKI